MVVPCSATSTASCDTGNRDWQLWPADEVEDATIGNVAPGYLDELALAESPAGSYLFIPGSIITIVEDPPGSGLFDASLSEPPLHGDPPGTGLYVFGTWIPGDYCPINWEMSFARQDITTRVLIGRPDMDEPDRARRRRRPRHCTASKRSTSPTWKRRWTPR